MGRVLSTCFPHTSGGWGELGSFVDLLDNIVEKAPPKARLPKIPPVQGHQKASNELVNSVWIVV